MQKTLPPKTGEFFYFPLHKAHAVGVAAQPPLAVSLNSDGRRLPTLYIQSIISSSGIIWVIPARDISAAISAFAAPEAFLF